jgi:hypothetical protein
VLVIHATAGASYAGDLAWLRKGGGEPPLAPVSCHYLIAPDGTTVQLVREHDTAWHTGAASWMVDGAPASGSYQGVARLNHLSIGIELSHPNRADVPYPAPQLTAAAALARAIIARHQIPAAQLVRHLDISPGRKTDPAGLPWQAFRAAVLVPAVPHTRVIGARPSISLAQFRDVLRRRGAPFGEHFDVISERIYRLCSDLDIDPAFWLALWLHEQGVPLGGSAIGKATRNPLNIKRYGPRWPGLTMNGAEWNSYESWQLGCLHSVMHLKELYGAKGLLTLEEIIPMWAPPGDGGNSPAAYIAAVKRDMAAMRSL